MMLALGSAEQVAAQSLLLGSWETRRVTGPGQGGASKAQGVALSDCRLTNGRLSKAVERTLRAKECWGGALCSATKGEH